MTRNYYLPQDESGRAQLLEHLAHHLPAYIDTLELSDTDLEELRADAAAYRYILAQAAAAQSHARQWTAFKKQQFGGRGLTQAYPDDSAIPTPPAVVPPGIVPRLIRLVARIKTARNYDVGIGRELGIVGTDHTIDVIAATPRLTVTLNAGHPVIRWTKGLADDLEILADRGDGQGFVLLTIARTTRVPDPSPLPHTPTVWKYKAIYRLKDERIGQWSAEVSHSVGG